MLRGVRCYSTKQTQGVMSFLDRMDALYTNQSAVNPSTTKNVDFKMKPNRPVKDAHMKSKAASAASSSSGQGKPGYKKRQQFRDQGSNKFAKPQQSQQQQQQPAQKVQTQKRNKMYNDDSYEGFMTSATVEKLDSHVAPQQFARTTKIQASRPAPNRRATRPTMPARFKAKVQGGPGAKGFQNKKKFQKSRAAGSGSGSRQQNSERRDNGSLAPNEAIEILQRQFASASVSGSSKNGFITVNDLNGHQLVPSFSTASTFDGRVVTAARRIPSSNVTDAINYSFKGLSADIDFSQEDISSQTLANTLNSQPGLSREFKQTLVDVATGKASLSSLKSSN